MFQRSGSEPSQKQEKKNEVNTRTSVEQSCALRSVVGRVSSTVWPLETVMNLKSFCMIFCWLWHNRKRRRRRNESTNIGRTTRPSMKLRNKNVKLTRTSIMKEGVKIRALTWRECSYPRSWYKRPSRGSYLPEATVEGSNEAGRNPRG